MTKSTAAGDAEQLATLEWAKGNLGHIFLTALAGPKYEQALERIRRLANPVHGPSAVQLMERAERDQIVLAIIDRLFPKDRENLYQLMDDRPASLGADLYAISPELMLQGIQDFTRALRDGNTSTARRGKQMDSDAVNAASEHGLICLHAISAADNFSRRQVEERTTLIAEIRALADEAARPEEDRSPDHRRDHIVRACLRLCFAGIARMAGYAESKIDGVFASLLEYESVAIAQDLRYSWAQALQSADSAQFSRWLIAQLEASAEAWVPLIADLRDIAVSVLHLAARDASVKAKLLASADAATKAGSDTVYALLLAAAGELTPQRTTILLLNTRTGPIVLERLFESAGRNDEYGIRSALVKATKSSDRAALLFLLHSIGGRVVTAERARSTWWQNSATDSWAMMISTLLDNSEDQELLRLGLLFMCARRDFSQDRLKLMRKKFAGTLPPEVNALFIIAQSNLDEHERR